MSDFTCARCSGSNIVPVQDQSEYQHEDDAPDDREKGWCDDCGDVTFIEE